MTVVEEALVSRFDYAYDANGNRESQVETRGLAGETTTYGYDEADRLIGVAYPAETHLYQVNAVGNRTGEKRAAAGVVAALTVAAFAALSPAVASAAVERQHNAVDWVTAVVDLKASTTTALTYDANGNRTGEGTKRYAWDIRDTLTRASDGATVLGTYDYDAKLQRVKADTTQGHVEYVLDGKYVLREAGARSRRYHFGEGEALAVTGVGGTSAQDSWLLIDGLGSVVTEANATATSVTARQFDAWGNYRNNTAPTANETRLGYTGHQFDVETGLTYARARYYDSKLGIFLSRDSYEGVLGEAPSLHRNVYAHGNPLRYRDPSGRCGEDTQGALACVQEDAASAWSALKSAWNEAFPDSDAPTGPDEPRRVEVTPNSGVALVDFDAPSRERMRFQQKWYRSLEQPTGTGGMSVMLNTDEEAALKTRRNVEGTLEGTKVAAQYTLEVTEPLLMLEAGIGLARVGARVVVEASVEKAAATAPERLFAREAAMKAETTVFEDAQALGGMTCPCFEAGTPVHTKSGVIAIEGVRVGDLVLSKDDKTGVVDYRPVVQLFVTPQKEVFELRLSDETGAETVLGVTPGHPFWVKDIGWVGAANLASGIEVANSSGAWLRVTGATWHQRKATVFNFEVEGFHTYFVGEAAAWVHNACSVSCKESVYVQTKNGKETYIGISNDAERRAAEHALDASKTGDKMRVRNNPLSHDDARTIEAKLIRARLAEAQEKGLITGAEPVKEQLEKAGLDNLNRGRDPSKWTDAKVNKNAVKDGATFDIRPIKKK
jgi:RHS repeat-associated protein